MVLAGNVDEIGIATALQQMWAEIGVTLDIEQVDNATRTARYRAGDFSMRLGYWTDDIADPNEITSYFGYSPTSRRSIRAGRAPRFNALFEASQQELDPAKRADAICPDAGDLRDGPTCRSTRRPIPWC